MNWLFGVVGGGGGGGRVKQSGNKSWSLEYKYYAFVPISVTQIKFVIIVLYIVDPDGEIKLYASWILKTFIFSKNAANFLKISRKHVFTASNMNVIKNRVEKRNRNKFCQKTAVFIFKL